MKYFEDGWWSKDAEWWQFWMPQSGFIGGVIMGLVVLIVVFGAVVAF